MKNYTLTLKADDPDGIGKDVWVCNHCGAHAGSPEEVRHYASCTREKRDEKGSSTNGGRHGAQPLPEVGKGVQETDQEGAPPEGPKTRGPSPAVRVRDLAQLCGGIPYVSKRGVPHVVKRGDGFSYSVSWFEKTKTFRVFFPYPGNNQTKLNFKETERGALVKLLLRLEWEGTNENN